MSALRAVAAAQTIPQRGDVRANLDAHLRLILAAAEHDVSLIVFPELSLTGYELDLAGELAFARDDPRLDLLIDAASECGMTLVAGAPAWLDGRLYIGAFILSPDRAVDLYTKHHLGAFTAAVNPGGPVPPAEASVFASGTFNPLLRFDRHTAAIAICADIGRPSHAEQAAIRGATIYLASTFVVPHDFDADTGRLASYAARHRMTVVFANYGGPSGGLPSAGRSAIWSADGELLARLEASGAGLVVATETGAGWRAEAFVAGDG
jgi:predicted amidohydrolase